MPGHGSDPPTTPPAAPSRFPAGSARGEAVDALLATQRHLERALAALFDGEIGTAQAQAALTEQSAKRAAGHLDAAIWANEG